MGQLAAKSIQRLQISIWVYPHCCLGTVVCIIHKQILKWKFSNKNCMTLWFNNKSEWPWTIAYSLAGHSTKSGARTWLHIQRQAERKGGGGIELNLQEKFTFYCNISFLFSWSDGSEENPHANCMGLSFTTVTSWK